MRGRRMKVFRAAVPSGAAPNNRALRNAVIALSVLAAAAAMAAIARSATAGAGLVRLPKISSVTVSDINDRGQVVGSLTKSHDDATRGFVWRKGALRLLGRGRFAGAREINDSGQIIGTSGDHEVLWKYGRAEELWPLTSVWALNDAGQVLGGNLVGDDIHGYSSAPCLWTNGIGVRSLPFAPGHPTAMNNLGQVVGQMPDGRAAEWRDGELTDLGPGAPIAINDQGDVLGIRGQDAILWHNGVPTDIGRGQPIALNERGEAIVSSGPWPFHALLWRSGIMTDLGTLGGEWAIPTAISDSGQVVGSSSDSRGVQHGFVWQNGVMIRLPSPAGYRGARTRALAITDHNQIIGDNCLWDCGENRSIRHPSRFAVLWTLRGHTIETRQLLNIRP